MPLLLLLLLLLLPLSRTMGSGMLLQLLPQRKGVWMEENKFNNSTGEILPIIVSLLLYEGE